MIPKLEMVGGRLTVRRGPAPRRSEDERRAHEPWRADGYNGDYKARRHAALNSTGGRCARCGKPIAHKKDGRWVMDGGETHHSVPLSRGGKSSPLVPLCIPCHRAADAAIRKGDRGLKNR